MLQPKRTKFRKQHKGRNRGLAQRGSTVSFGDIALKSTSRGRLTARQIEAARRAMTRHIKRGGKIWIRVFPDKPITQKPLEVRQGKGKGNVEYWVAQIQPGKILYEMEGVDETVAREAFALAAALGTRNFDEADSAYTAKFKKLQSVSAVNIGSAAIQAITGFTPQLGQDEAAGHMANTYIDIGGRDFVVEGTTLTANVFIDEIHATDWIIARTEEESLGILLNNDRVPFTDKGMEQLASAARTVMRQAFRAGIIADDLNPVTGLYEPSVVITVPSVFDVPESQRKARIAPEITVTFRYAGAVHFTTIHYKMTF